MGEPVKQALKEAERAAKKQKLCVEVSTGGISAVLRNLVAAREQVSVCTDPALDTWKHGDSQTQHGRRGLIGSHDRVEHNPSDLRSSHNTERACIGPACCSAGCAVQVQATGSAEAAAREIASLVQCLTAGDKVAAISDATKDLHTAISKLEKVIVLLGCALCSVLLSPRATFQECCAKC